MTDQFVSATDNERTLQWQTFLDIDLDLKPWLQMDPSAGTANDAKLRMVADLACQWVQNYLSRPVVPTTVFRRFDGWAGMTGAYIMLPYVPVLKVLKVVEYWGSSGPHVLVEQTPEFQGESDMFQVEPTTGRLIRSFTGLVQRPFFPGSRNIEVTWVAGYNPLPADIKMAALEYAAHWWRNTQEAPHWFQPGGASYDQPQQNPLWPGVPNRVTDLLESYTQFSIA